MFFNVENDKIDGDNDDNDSNKNPNWVKLVLRTISMTFMLDNYNNINKLNHSIFDENIVKITERIETQLIQVKVTHNSVENQLQINVKATK